MFIHQTAKPQKLVELNEEIDKSTNIIGEFNMSLSNRLN